MEKVDISVRNAEHAQEIIGHFVVHCSLMDYRASQFIARWFLEDDKLKYLSYVLHAMNFEEKRNIIAERMIDYFPNPDDLLSLTGEAELIMQRRNLVTRGLLSTMQGEFCIKSFSASKFLSAAEGDDVIMVKELPGWAARARAVAERLVEISSS